MLFIVKRSMRMSELHHHDYPAYPDLSLILPQIINPPQFLN